jgi:hypothetical protein
MRLIGAIDPDEEMTAGELASCLEAMNKMLDSWNAEGAMLYALEMYSVDTLERSVDLGPGADLDMPRPDSLEDGQVFLKFSDQSVNYRLTKMTQPEWAVREADTTSTGTPSRFYYDKVSPTGTLNFDITPNTTYTLQIYLHRMLAQITDASAAILLPPSYADALDFNLAVRIAPEFGQDIPAVVAELAVSLKAKIQRKNLRMETVAPDGYGRGGYDIRTDRFI